MRLPDNPAVLVGTSTADDAGVVRLDDETALVQTVDFFPPMVDDPHDFGRVGAANSVSDVYAMGGRPVSAVSVFALPPDIAEHAPAQILQGAVDALAAEGIPLVGGHTVKDVEVKFGLCVTGVIHPDRIVRNVGAQVGDRLVLTKPLGSGFLCSALKGGRLDESGIRAVVEIMAASNGPAARAMMSVGVHAATDITGYGLLGHSVEMAAGSGVTVELAAAAAPWIDGLEGKVLPENTCGGLKKNAAYAEGHVAYEGGTDEQHAVLADPQTSGGLLIAVAEDRLPALLDALAAEGAPCAAVVGRVTARSDADVVVV